jgi:hypothetical protein
VARAAAHGGDVAQVYGQRFPTQVGQGRQAQVRVHPGDDGVGRYEQQAFRLRAPRHPDHGGIVAEPGLAVRGGRQEPA